MGFIIDFVTDVFDTVVDFVTDIFTEGPFNAIFNLVSNVWNITVTYIIEPIMNFLGFKDQDIYMTDVIACKIYDEDFLDKTRKELILDYMKKESMDALGYIKGFADRGDKQFQSYYRTGKESYTDYLPTTQLASVTIDKNKIQEIIEDEVGETIGFDKVTAGIPYKDDWCKFRLQEDYGYDISEDYVLIGDVYYTFTSSEYDENRDVYIATLSELSQVRKRVYRETLRYASEDTYLYDVRNIAVTDIKIVEENVSTNTYTTTSKSTSTNADGQYVCTTIVTQRVEKVVTDIDYVLSTEHSLISTSTEIVDTPVTSSDTVLSDSVTELTTLIKTYTYNVNRVLLNEEVIQETKSNEDTTYAFYDNVTTDSYIENVISESLGQEYVRQYTEINEITTYSRVDTGSDISSETVNVSLTYIYVPINSTIVTSNTELISNEIVDEGTGTTKEITIESFDNVRMYMVQYTVISTGKQYYWLYDPNTEVYPDLSSPVSLSENIECYPIVMIRNMFYNVDDYNVGGRPGSITKDRYDSTVEVLDSLGMTVEDLIDGYEDNPDIDQIQDVFFLLGVSPSNKNEVVSKALYEFFDFIYTNMPYSLTISDEANTMSAAFKEDPYNAAMTWLPRPVVIHEEVIGSLGTHTHEIETDSATGTVANVRVVTYGNKTNEKIIETYVERKLIDSHGDVVSEYRTDIKTTTVIDITNQYPIGLTRDITSTETEDGKSLIIKKQITPTTTRVLTLFAVTAFNIVRRGVDNGGVSLDVDNENLVIPLPVPVVERLTVIDRTALLGEACYLVIYAYAHQHLKWYQTAAFANFLKFLTIGITIVISIVSFGTFSAQAVTLSSVVMSILQSLIIGVGLSLALQVISTAVQDTTLKMILSGVAVVAAALVAGSITSENFFTSAMELLKAPLTAIDIYLDDQMDALSKDIDAFKEEYERRTELMSDILQDLSSGIDPMTMVNITLDPFGTDSSGLSRATSLSPTEFFALSIDGYRNYSTLYDGLYDSTVHDYVTNKLRIGISPNVEEE